MRKPLLAIVGRPNVGKSTLFNRFVGGRPALVHDTPGLTRDRRYGELDYFGHHFRVVDTGGLDPDAASDYVGAGIHRQARLALEEADLVIFVIDVTAGLTPTEHELADMLRRLNKPVVVAANKADSDRRAQLAAELYELGLERVYPVSAAHGRGVDDMLDAIVEVLEMPPPTHDTEDGDEAEDDDDRPVRIAFIGKPNAGKSSLVNRLLGSERALVHDQPGTTTDPVDTPFEMGGKRYVLVDTAGMRRRARIDEETEKISVSMALSQLRRADVAVLVIDANEGPSEQDSKLVGASEEYGRGLVIALNKSDLLDGPGAAKKVRKKAADDLHFARYAPMHLVSALRGDGVVELIEAVDHVCQQHRRRIPTAELNRFFAEVCETVPPPVYRGKVVRIHYLTQAATRPPTFLLWANSPNAVAPSYRRFLVNQLRKRYQFRGTPLRVFVRAKKKAKLPKKGKSKGKKPRRRR
jgi:GTP-binding protein